MALGWRWISLLEFLIWIGPQATKIHEPNTYRTPDNDTMHGLASDAQLEYLQCDVLCYA